MALRFIDSFAHYGSTYANAKWTDVFLVSYNGTNGPRGNPVIQGPGNLLKTLTHQTRYIQGARIKHNESRGDSLALLNNGSTIAKLTMNSDSTMSVVAGTVRIGTSPIAVADPTSWHYYEMDAIVGANGGGTVTLTASIRVDGASFGSFSGTSGISTAGLIDNAATVNQVGFLLNTNAVCDYYCIDTAGTDMYGNATTLTTFLSDVEIDALFPAADVTNNWSQVGGTTGTYFTSVNDNPPDADTSYVYTTSTGSVQSFNYQPLSGFTGTILGLQYLTFDRKTDEGTRVIAMTVGSNTCTTIEFLGTKNYLSDFYVYYIAPLDTDFNTAWTTDVYNAATFGIKLLS